MASKNLPFLTKNYQKMTVLQQTFNHYSILAEKKRLKQIWYCPLILWASFDTSKSIKGAILVDLMGLYLYFLIFSIMVPPRDCFSWHWTNSNCMFNVLMYLKYYLQQSFSQNWAQCQQSINYYYSQMQWFWSKYPNVYLPWRKIFCSSKSSTQLWSLRQTLKRMR